MAADFQFVWDGGGPVIALAILSVCLFFLSHLAITERCFYNTYF